MSKKTEAQLIKRVFANDDGRELLALWGEIFMASSHQFDNTSEHTAFKEGTRAFYVAIHNIFNEETK